MHARTWYRSALAVGLLGALLLLGMLLRAQDATGSATVRITAAGDYGRTANTEAVLNRISALAPDAHLAVGDLSYDTRPESDWCAFVKARVGQRFPFQLLAGNHEMNGPHGHINNFSACLPNQVPGVVGTYGREYYLDLPATGPLVRTIAISPGLAFPDGTWSYAVGDPHYNWLVSAIDGARAAGIPFVVVSAHYPCIGNGAYGCVLPDPVFRLLLDRRVDLVLHGHDHHYNRTHQLRQGVANCAALPPTTYNAACVADTDNAYVSGNGTVLATVGTGGIPLRDINTTLASTRYLAAMSGLNANPTYGVLELTATQQELSASFVRAAGGTFTDSFRIAKDPAAAPLLPAGSTWRLNDSGADLGTGWRAPAYDDTSWRSGRAQWGYGDGDEATTLSFGAQPTAKPITVYGRSSFDVATTSGITGIDLRAIVDDGAVVYLNGTEVWRQNMPAGTITAGTRAATTVAGAAESQWLSVRIPATALRAGRNTVAVEVHQDSPSSSDISFDLQLAAVR